MMENKKFYIVGADGQLANAFIRQFEKRGIEFVAKEYKELDITQFQQTESAIIEAQPDVLINCAAYNFVEQAQENMQQAFAVNRDAVGNLARICKQNHILFVHFSTDYVFDGAKNDLYSEGDKPNPLNVYGSSKWEGELAIQQQLVEYLIFRLSWVYGNGQSNFLYKLRNWANGKKELNVVNDEVSVPTYTEDIVQVVIEALQNNLRGLFHLTNSGYCSRYDWAKYFFELIKGGVKVSPAKSATFSTKAERPAFSAMSNKLISEKLGIVVPNWQDAMKRFVEKNNLSISQSSGSSK